MRRALSRLAAAALPLAAAARLVACAEATSEGFTPVADAGRDATTRDAGTDAGPLPDGGASNDGGATDSGAADGGLADSGASDSGGDAALPDSGAQDSGAPDAGPRDSGAPFPPPPTCDGTLSLGEYPTTYATAEGQSLAVAWDDTSLYLALANANLAEPFVFVLGDGVGGTTNGQSYDNLAPTLPFPARLAVYAKASYQEVRTYDGAAWSLGAAPTCFQTTGGAAPTRELAIPWARLGGRPASFQFLSYVVYPNGNSFGTYAVAPTASLVGSTFTKWFQVPSSAPAGLPTVFSTVRP